MRRIILFFLVLAVICPAAPAALAAEGERAEELTAAARIECSGGAPSALTDGRESSYTTVPAGGSVTLSAQGGISSLYVIFDRVYGAWTLSDGTAEVPCGADGFLHEYIDVSAAFGCAPETLTMTFPGESCALAELHLFGAGQVPDWVQIWEPPCEKADLALFSTHIDDEQLFFAGVLPYYAGERGLAVQVIYFTDPFSYHDRPHEQLNGLWTVGVRNYPVCGPYPDAYSESAQEAYRQQENYGYTKEDMLRFQAENLRRFQPHVVVGHDVNGEYGHGQHRINSETLREALDLAADPSYDPDSAARYGVWDTPKAYLHLWAENPLVMDWDVPLEAFGGKTAFQVSQDGFLCHGSQQWTWFRRWMFGSAGNITRADQIASYSPCLYGLFRTTVGADTAGGDMFENIPLSYAEIAAEEERRLEEERLREEEEARRREEEARKAEEEQAAREAEASAAPAPSAQPEEARTILGGLSSEVITLIVAAIAGIAAVIYILIRGRRKS